MISRVKNVVRSIYKMNSCDHVKIFKEKNSIITFLFQRLFANLNEIKAVGIDPLEKTMVEILKHFVEYFLDCGLGNNLTEKTIKRAFESNDTDEMNYLTDLDRHNDWKMIKKDDCDLWIYSHHPLPVVLGVLPGEIWRWSHRMPVLKSL